jgi:hypothetical protein
VSQVPRHAVEDGGAEVPGQQGRLRADECPERAELVAQT